MPKKDTVPLGKGVYSVPIWSPDSAYLAFSFEDNGSDGLWLFEIESERLFTLETEGRVSLRGGGSWENSDVFWFIATSGFLQASVYKVDIHTNELQKMVNSTPSWLGFSVHPFSNQLTYSQLVKEGEVENAELYSLDTITGSVVQLTDTIDLLESYPLWSPKGERFAFIVREAIGIKEQEDVVYIEADVKGGVGSLAWSPDGQWLLFIGRYDQPGLYLVNTDGTDSPEMILSGSYSYVAWSPNGSMIAYTTLGVPGSNELHIVDAKDLGFEDFKPQS